MRLKDNIGTYTHDLTIKGALFFSLFPFLSLNACKQKEDNVDQKTVSSLNEDSEDGEKAFYGWGIKPKTSSKSNINTDTSSTAASVNKIDALNDKMKSAQTNSQTSESTIGYRNIAHTVGFYKSFEVEDIGNPLSNPKDAAKAPEAYRYEEIYPDSEPKFDPYRYRVIKLYEYAGTGYREYHLLPTFDSLMHGRLDQSGINDYQEVILKILATKNGKDWYAKDISSQIRNWLLNKDYDLYQNFVPLNIKEGSHADSRPGIVPYRLPDGGLINIRKEMRDLIINRWAVQYRPGNL